MIQPIDIDGLGDELRIGLLDHIHDLLLDKVQVLGIAGRRAADDIVDLDVVFLFTVASTVHSVGELDEDRVLLHDALDVLTTDTNDALVVLIRNVERDGRGHLLLNEVKTVLRGFVLGATDYDVEVVLVEAIEDDLHTTVAHDLVDLAILLTTDELFVLVGKLDLHTHIVLRLLHEWNVTDDHQSSPDSIVGSVDVEVELLEADFSARVDADVGEHRTYVSGCRWALCGVRVSDEP